jgi:glycosyltransferase involved in cell wall biosynthesis
MLPFVSLVTPTYNRRRFIPGLLRMMEQQTYPIERMEWIVIDDGQEEVEDLFEAARDKIPHLVFIRHEDKLTIGEKRNLLNTHAMGDIIIAIDDDDFYFPDRVSAAVDAFLANPKINLVGSSEVYMFFTDTKEIYKIGPYFPKHATNGTMAWRKRYASTHRYDETVAFAEEKSFLDQYKNPIIQLDPMKVMLVISHSDNTFDKTELRTANNPMIKKTDLTLGYFIKDPVLKEFFENA